MLLHGLATTSEGSRLPGHEQHPARHPGRDLGRLETDAESFAQELPLLAAVKLFELGKLSSGRAAQLAGMGRVEFLMAMPRYQVAPFRLTEEELRRDLRNA